MASTANGPAGTPGAGPVPTQHQGTDAAVWYFTTVHRPTRSGDVARLARAEGFNGDVLAGARRTCGAAVVWHDGAYWDLPDGCGRRDIPRRRGGAR